MIWIEIQILVLFWICYLMLVRAARRLIDLADRLACSYKVKKEGES